MSKWLPDVGLLLLRLSVGPMMLFGHGLTKLGRMPELMDSFPDPLGVGSAFSAVLAVFAEVVCSALLALGLGTRFAALNLVITMAVAALIVHGDDPWARKEMAVIYGVTYLALLVSGAGRLSLDSVIWAKLQARGQRPEQ